MRSAAALLAAGAGQLQGALCSATRKGCLLLWPRIRRHQPVQAVVHHHLPVVFSRVLAEVAPELVRVEAPARSRDDLGEVGLFQHGRAFGDGLLRISHNFGLVLEARTLGLVFFLRLLTLQNGLEVIDRSGGVQQLLGERTHFGFGLVVVLVLWKIFGHLQNLSRDVLPGAEKTLVGIRGRCRSRLLLRLPPSGGTRAGRRRARQKNRKARGGGNRCTANLVSHEFSPSKMASVWTPDSFPAFPMRASRCARAITAESGDGGPRRLLQASRVLPRDNTAECGR